jgi:hypothetical protein
MNASRELPQDYAPTFRLDMNHDKKALVWLNVVGTVLLFLFGWLFFQWILWLRPQDLTAMGFSVNGLAAWLIFIAVLALATVAVIFIHEAVHGLTFWLLFHQKPTFGFRGAYAFAATPGWYLPRAPYLVVALAPLIVLSLVCMGLMLVIPARGLLYVLLFAALNASGAVGDMAVAAKLLSRSAATLIEDTGETITFYEERSGSSADGREESPSTDGHE